MFKIPPLWPFFYEFSESLPWPSLSFSEIRKTSREALQSALMGERRPLRLFAEGSFPNMIFFFLNLPFFILMFKSAVFLRL